jgi:hypothetical protein
MPPANGAAGALAPPRERRLTRAAPFGEIVRRRNNGAGSSGPLSAGRADRPFLLAVALRVNEIDVALLFVFFGSWWCHVRSQVAAPRAASADSSMRACLLSP